MSALVVSLAALGLVLAPSTVLASVGTSDQYELELIRWLGVMTAALIGVEAAGRRWARPVSPPSVVLRLLLPVVAALYVVSGSGFYLVMLFCVLTGTALLRALVTVDHVMGGTHRRLE